MAAKPRPLWRVFGGVSTLSFGTAALTVTYVLAWSILIGVDRPQISGTASMKIVWWPFLLVALLLVLLWVGGVLAGLSARRSKPVLLLGGVLCTAAGIWILRRLPPYFLLIERQVLYTSMPFLKVLPWLAWTVGFSAAGLSLILYLRSVKSSGQLPTGG